MIAAVAGAAAEKGYANATVGDVIKRAGVSRETFYEQFAGKEACFLAAFDAGVEAMIGRMGDALADTAGDPVERADRALAAYFAALESEPDFARAFLVEVYAVGPHAVQRRAVLQQRFVEAMAAVFGVERGGEDWFACEALVAAVSSLVTTRVGAGRGDDLDSLRAPLVDLVRRSRR